MEVVGAYHCLTLTEQVTTVRGGRCGIHGRPVAGGVALEGDALPCDPDAGRSVAERSTNREGRIDSSCGDVSSRGEGGGGQWN